jgi:hypothetical protein
MIGGAVDRVEEDEEIGLLLRRQLGRDRVGGRQPVQPVERKDLGQGLRLAAVQIRRVIADAQQ